MIHYSLSKDLAFDPQKIITILDFCLEPRRWDADFLNAFESFTFSFGDPIIDSGSTDEPALYFILQGQVRLVSFNPSKNREVSVQLLKPGDSFGADRLWGQSHLTYRAIAKDTVEVARIKIEQHKLFLEQYPDLKTYLRTQTQYRQKLIFFKTLTAFQDLSSYQLQQILPDIQERQFPDGEILGKTASGHCWLLKGKIKQQSLKIGDSFGYPDPIPPDWLAQGDVWLYEISQEDWEKAFSPILPPATPVPKTPVVSPSCPPIRDVKTLPEKSTLIEFPKPLKPTRHLWGSFPFIEQQSAADCGATCLAMISQYWGKRPNLNWLRELVGVGRSGASLKNLAKAAEGLGFQARPVRASLNRLLEQKNPWIAHWQGDHYVVVYRVKGDRLLIADPAQGKRQMSRQEFREGWTGYGLLLDPTEALNEVPTQKRSLGRFIRLLLPYQLSWMQVIVASFLIQVFGLITPLFTQIILDQVVVNKSLSTLHIFALGVLLFSVWNVLLSGIRQYLLSYLSNRLDLTLITGFIAHTLILPLKFFETRHVGDIITRVNENQKIQRFLLNQVLLAWLDFLMGFVYLALMLYYNWQLTLLVVALIPPIMILTLAATPLLRRVSREVFNRSAEQNSVLVETITGIDTVKATASELELRWRWEDRLTHYLNARFRSQKLGINLQALSGLINTLGTTALLWYGAMLVIQDQLTIGQFVAFNMMIGKVLNPVLSLANLWDELQEVLISVERLNDIFDSEPEEIASQPMLVLPPLKGDVRFENITFRYDQNQDRNTLQNITFTVKAGQTIAIVGRSGSGKSTLVKLLQGLYYPENGYIWFDDHDIRHVSPRSLRSQLGVVPQECFLFSGTILENITLYRPEFSLEEAINAAKLAEAHGFIQSMPLGYNTKVGERGANLSGGQRQRIAIARALLGEPRILVLDEATSSLDTESERRFQENLTRLSKNRTTFIIAHRLSSVRNADQILVLDRGILAEQGKHEELMAKGGIYAHLVGQQLNL